MVSQGRLHFCVAVLAACVAFMPLAHAQTRADCEREYMPQRAQEGKDVIWAPTEDSMVGPMLEIAKVTAADKVYDLGAGDGKIVIAAAKQYGATGVGIEYDADLVQHARCLAAAERVHDRVTFIQGDIFETDFSDATVVALYLTPAVNRRLLPAFLAMKPGTRIVSYSFPIGDWEPDGQIDSFGDGSVFPSGPMREPLEAGLARADAVVVLMPPGLATPDPDLMALFGAKPILIARLEPAAPPPSGPQLGFAGVGKPWKVERALREAGCELVDFAAFPDHSTYDEDTLRHLDARARAHGAGLVTTDKDWVRLPSAWRGRIRAWPVRARFVDQAALDRLLEPLTSRP